jgi:hypothetical protein
MRITLILILGEYEDGRRVDLNQNPVVGFDIGCVGLHVLHYLYLLGFLPRPNAWTRVCLMK